MKTLTLLRHAKAEPESPGGDFDRALSERGRADARQMGKEMRSLGLEFDRVVASPARRVLETVSEVGELSPIFDRRVYDASTRDLLDIVLDTSDEVDRLLLVGHNPGMERLAARLLGNAVCEMPAGALVEIALPGDRWQDAAESGGQLVRFVTPKQLG